MITTDKHYPKRTQRDYTLGFKLQVVDVVLKFTTWKIFKNHAISVFLG